MKSLPQLMRESIDLIENASRIRIRPRPIEVKNYPGELKFTGKIDGCNLALVVVDRGLFYYRSHEIINYTNLYHFEVYICLIEDGIIHFSDLLKVGVFSSNYPRDLTKSHAVLTPGEHNLKTMIFSVISKKWNTFLPLLYSKVKNVSEIKKMQKELEDMWYILSRDPSKISAKKIEKEKEKELAIIDEKNKKIRAKYDKEYDEAVRGKRTKVPIVGRHPTRWTTKADQFWHGPDPVLGDGGHFEWPEFKSRRIGGGPIYGDSVPDFPDEPVQYTLYSFDFREKAEEIHRQAVADFKEKMEKLEKEIKDHKDNSLVYRLIVEFEKFPHPKLKNDAEPEHIPWFD